MAKNILVPSNARCALVVVFKTMFLDVQSWEGMLSSYL